MPDRPKPKTRVRAPELPSNVLGPHLWDLQPYTTWNLLQLGGEIMTDPRFGLTRDASTPFWKCCLGLASKTGDGHGFQRMHIDVILMGRQAVRADRKLRRGHEVLFGGRLDHQRYMSEIAPARDKRTQKRLFMRAWSWRYLGVAPGWLPRGAGGIL